MCIESHFIIFSMDDFWLALIVTNQSQQSLALDVDVLEFASQIEILRKLIHFILPSLSLSHWLFLCAFGLAFLFFFADLCVFFCAISRMGFIVFFLCSRHLFFFLPLIHEAHFLWVNTTCGHIFCLFRAGQPSLWKQPFFFLLENFSCFSFHHVPIHDDDCPKSTHIFWPLKLFIKKESSVSIFTSWSVVSFFFPQKEKQTVETIENLSKFTQEKLPKSNTLLRPLPRTFDS